MTDHPHRARRVVARGTLSVALVLALSGALFAANAKFARAASGERHPQDLRELAQVETAKVERLATEVDDLRAVVDDLTADENAGTPVGRAQHGVPDRGRDRARHRARGDRAARRRAA